MNRYVNEEIGTEIGIEQGTQEMEAFLEREQRGEKTSRKNK